MDEEYGDTGEEARKCNADFQTRNVLPVVTIQLRKVKSCEKVYIFMKYFCKKSGMMFFLSIRIVRRKLILTVDIQS